MVNSLLFRWEDSQALQHHCGFCERPLAHPAARASCFGTHSEPCHRFHQALFMRNQAHLCKYCTTIDEAHYKRHHGLVEQLRRIYESCGEADWTIVPVEPGDPRRCRSTDAQTADSEASGCSITADEASTSRRERKDAKCLARAANRTKVVTQEEIRYVDSVLHSSEGVADADGVCPANVEEMQLIEEHLRYNANVYNSHSNSKALKLFAKIPEVDVDFESEVARVLDTFRIGELVKRNLRNRGLQGKELKTFENLIDVFRNTVVEDLVLVKKDVIEIRMRRAGYLRYTNKTAYNIVEERYTEKDWKTGERKMSSTSESSGLSSSSYELAAFCSGAPEPSETSHSSAFGPDHRHLHNIHTRVTGDDGLGQTVIEPYHAPLLPLMPNTVQKKPVVLQLKMIESEEKRIPAGQTDRGWLTRHVARQSPSVQLLTMPEDGESPQRLPSHEYGASNTPRTRINSGWGKVTSVRSSGRLSSRLTDEKSWSTSIPSDKLAVQPPAEDGKVSLHGPERLITDHEDEDCWHPVVSQKKAKKAQREAKRKAKKAIEPSVETLAPTAEGEADFEQVALEPCKESSSGSADHDDSKAMDEKSPQSSSDPITELMDDGKDCISIVAVKEHITIVDILSKSSFTPIPRTTHGRHDHWVRFMRTFTVDQLTVPLLQSFEGCSHGSSCRFERHGVSDCPFHEPHCPCTDPVLDKCYLMYPGKQPFTSGPYNRAQGQRLMAMYEQQDHTQGRVMLIDDDLVQYFLGYTGKMPPRLLQEHAEYLSGYDRGPLMKQETEFERLFVKNMTLKHGLTMKTLEGIQRENDTLKGSVQSCYCRVGVLPKASEIKKEFGNDFVRCSYFQCDLGGFFHKRCVKKLGVEKVSRWYCTDCEMKMKVWAYKALNIPTTGDAFKKFTDKEKGIAKKSVAQMT